MARIKLLDSLLASKIAAGEVIERPASIVKELLENSVDAGASSISAYLTEGGKRVVCIVDNGEGIAREDAPNAFLRHATSKISSEEDLESILTMGFRGEALASIAAVARVTLRTRRPGDEAGTSVVIEGGSAPVVADDGCPEGTSIEVRDLFYNTPARLKFLRSAEAEYGHILDIFKRIALANPDKRFRLAHGRSKPIEAPPGGLRERILDLFGGEVVKYLVDVSSPNVKGYVSTQDLTFHTTKGFYLYVNRRPVRDKSINRAILDGYGAMLEGGRYPFAVLDINIDPGDVDINIHPTKTEVRFRSQRLVYDSVKIAIRAALAKGLTLSSREAGHAPAQAHTAPGASFYALGPEKSLELNESTAPLDVTGAQRSLVFHGGEEDVKNPEFLECEPVGQLWGEFLIAEGSNGVYYIIDQHGAAERSAFERLKKRYASGAGLSSQMLLVPERMETTPEERDAVNSASEHLKKFGFEIAPFGPSLKHGGESFFIKAVPHLLSTRSNASLIKSLAEELSSTGGSSRVDDKIEEALMRIACHSVIRGPRRLTREEGSALLRGLARIDFALHCPHGRPVVKRCLRGELEAFFKR